MQLNKLSGVEFEHLCADLLRKDGFQNVRLTKATADRGVDIFALKNGVSFAIQCKRYTSPVGNGAVREAYTGKAIYKCDVAVVMTNSTFTQAAREDAAKTGVLLWDGSELRRLNNQAKLFDQVHKTSVKSTGNKSYRIWFILFAIFFVIANYGTSKQPEKQQKSISPDETSIAQKSLQSAEPESKSKTLLKQFKTDYIDTCLFEVINQNNRKYYPLTVTP